MFSLDETIIACGTAHGSGLRGVLRLSGEGAVRALDGLFHGEPNDDQWSRCDQLNEPRIFCGTLTPWEPQCKIPCEVYFWPKGRGYTGQKSIELHLWGSEPILDAVQQRILASEHEQVRLANAGEFTLRAFLAGRLDLTQAEAVLGIIDANDLAHLNVALKQLAGGIGRPLHNVREHLIETLAHLEAGLDFVDEEIDFISPNELAQNIQSGIEALQKILKQITTRNLSGKTVRVLLTGAPNVGKSSLYNRLIENGKTENRAIVSNIPGTTRDYLESSLRWNGIPLNLIDSAGIETENPPNSSEIETPDNAAQRFSREILEEADLLLLCENANEPTLQSPFYEKPTIFVLTKCDQENSINSKKGDNFLHIIKTSAKTGQGIDELREAILEWIVNRFGTPEVVPATAVRCRNAIEKSISSLKNARNLIEQNDEMLVASELRGALDQLGQVLGVVHTDDLLDRIFSNFCIGK